MKSHGGSALLPRPHLPWLRWSQGSSGRSVVAGIFLQAGTMPLVASKMKQGDTESDAG